MFSFRKSFVVIDVTGYGVFPLGFLPCQIILKVRNLRIGFSYVFAVGMVVAGLYWALVFDSGKALESQITLASQEITKSLWNSLFIQRQ